MDEDGKEVMSSSYPKAFTPASLASGLFVHSAGLSYRHKRRASLYRNKNSTTLRRYLA